MEILKILTEPGQELYPEDLDFFETELAVGEYSAEYIAACKEMIQVLRNWGKDTRDIPQQLQSIKKRAGVQLDLNQVAPAANNPAYSQMTGEEYVRTEVGQLRCRNTYKSDFKKFIAACDVVDAAFIEKHFSFFDSWELGAILSVKQLGEPFLEKYFGALDLKKLARYQKFSESFFMKHFSQLDAEIVLLHGKNEWRKKENRSSQLDVFLRLKGITI